MGRYYNGDIEGKFWFGVQASNAADRFGAYGCEPNYINYYFTEDHLEEVQKELKVIEETIGEENMKKLDEFFDKVNGYNDNILKEHGVYGVWSEHRRDYADYFLGKKIEKCIIETGECCFEAEL